GRGEYCGRVAIKPPLNMLPRRAWPGHRSLQCRQAGRQIRKSNFGFVSFDAGYVALKVDYRIPQMSTIEVGLTDWVKFPEYIG
ncbi:MAG: hypothetical protein WCJ76_12005, partial [Comamonadaceae bacterium]